MKKCNKCINIFYIHTNYKHTKPIWPPPPSLSSAAVLMPYETELGKAVVQG